MFACLGPPVASSIHVNTRLGMCPYLASEFAMWGESVDEYRRLGEFVLDVGHEILSQSTKASVKVRKTLHPLQ